jgi:hypothetical protein
MTTALTAGHPCGMMPLRVKETGNAGLVSAAVPLTTTTDHDHDHDHDH